MSLNLKLNKIFSCYTVQIYRIFLEFLLHLSLNPHQKFGLTALFPSATTANVLYGGIEGGSWNEPAQVDALSADTKVVTLSIGGNDVGFSDYMLGCVAVCGQGTPEFNAVRDAIYSNALSENLRTTYEEILRHAPNTQVYVADYPYFTPAGNSFLRCSIVDVTMMHDLQTALNGVIAQSINTVAVLNQNNATNRLHYVNTNLTSSPFGGRGICTSVPSDFHLLRLDQLEYSFHPIAPGYRHYAQIVRKAIAL